ncbi:MAG: hypothetical protein AB1810_03535 [Pseudomonadota bacterium]
MPILIDEVIAEVNDSVTQPAEVQPAAQQSPLSVAEYELLQTLALIQQRQERLKVD